MAVCKKCKGNTEVKCPGCKGSGKKQGFICVTCRGNGVITCRSCGGTGRV